MLVIAGRQDSVGFLTECLCQAGYHNVQAATEVDSLEHCLDLQVPDIVLVDAECGRWPDETALANLERRVAAGQYVPILVLHPKSSQEDQSLVRERVIERIEKPVGLQELMARVESFLLLRSMHLELRRHNQQHHEIADWRTTEGLETLARAAEHRDDETGNHTRRVGILSAAIANELGESRQSVTAIELTAPLHDIGKIAIPDAILMKPGKLEPEEMAVMRRHAVVGEAVFTGMDSPLMRLAATIARSHHERWDGAGYPDGKKGTEIPLAARIVAVADVYDALTHARPYKPAWTCDRAIAEIQAQSGRQFDPRVVDAFLAVVAKGDPIAA